MNVIQAINAIREQKLADGIFPTHATMVELIAAGCSQSEIRQAAKSGKIKWGKTINSYYFTCLSE
jgi:hypothetical protein